MAKQFKFLAGFLALLLGSPGAVPGQEPATDTPQAGAQTGEQTGEPTSGDPATRIEPGVLQQRLRVTEIEVEVPIDAGSVEDNPSSFSMTPYVRPIVLSPQPNGGSKIGWTDTEGRVHVTPLDANDRRVGTDTILASGSLRDFVAHDNGFAALVLEADGMHLVRYEDEKPVFRTRLIANWSGHFHMGSLAWNGKRYAAYFAIHGGGHEGDALKYVDAEGQLLAGGWNWGCSHSIDMRIVAVGDRFMPIALSDAYPGTGIFFNHNQKRVSYVWGDARGSTGGRLGGLVALGDRMFVAFSSRQGGRPYWTAALADFAQETPHEQTVHKYLQDAEADQLNVKLARYGMDKLLVSWRQRGLRQRTFRLYDSEAHPVSDPERLPVEASPRADMRTDAQGHVVWAGSWGEQPRKLRIARIRANTGN